MRWPCVGDEFDEESLSPYSTRGALESDHTLVSLFSRNHEELEVQLEALCRSKPRPAKITEQELTLFVSFLLPLIEDGPGQTAAERIIESGIHTDIVLRMYMATLDKKKKILSPVKKYLKSKNQFLVTSNTTIPMTRIATAGVVFKQGLLWMLYSTQQWREEGKISLNIRTEGASPLTVTVQPSVVTFHPPSDPSSITVRQLMKQPPSVMRDCFDCMLQTLALEFSSNSSDFPRAPLGDGRSVELSCCCDADALPLPVVHAILPNPWMSTSYHRQLMCILTFYKLHTIRDTVLKEMADQHWPRDINARGTSAFRTGTGSERVFTSCGVRLHLGEREYCRQSLETLSLVEIQNLFGRSKRNPVLYLTPREIRRVMEVIDFPYIMALAFIRAFCESSPRCDEILTWPPGSYPVGARARRQSQSGEGSVGMLLEATGPLYGFYMSLAIESCLNARFLSIMETVRDILQVYTPGQAVNKMYQSLVATEPDLDQASLPEMAHLVNLRFQQTNKFVWDPQESTFRPIQYTDITTALRLIGYA